jgi:hypothetical protein
LFFPTFAIMNHLERRSPRMKRYTDFVGVGLVAAVLVIAAAPASAQTPYGQSQQPAQGPSGAHLLEIKKIAGAKMLTPEYALRKNQTQQRSRDWYEIACLYETEPAWLEEAKFTFFVLVRSKEPNTPPVTVFRGEVTYINIEKGRHKADIFMHPSTLARFGAVERVAVVVNAGGRTIIETDPPSNQRWWEQLNPVDGYLLHRLRTPFAMLNFDDYEQIKVKE